jgi:hypothetical protein
MENGGRHGNSAACKIDKAGYIESDQNYSTQKLTNKLSIEVLLTGCVTSHYFEILEKMTKSNLNRNK